MVTSSLGTHLASGSRDRLIHLFRIEKDRMVLVTSLDKHQSSVTRVKLLGGDSVSVLSCGGDRVFLRHCLDPNDQLYLRQSYTEGKFYDMCTTASKVFLLQDKKITSLDLADNKQNKVSFETKEYILGKHVYLENIRGCVASHLLIVFSTDKVIRVRDTNKGLQVLQKIVIADIVTRLCVSQNSLYLSSIEGILYVYSLLLPATSRKSGKLNAISKQIVTQINTFKEERGQWDSEEKKEELEMENTPLWAKTRPGTNVVVQEIEEDFAVEQESLVMENLDEFINLNTRELNNNRLGNHQPRVSITS